MSENLQEKQRIRFDFLRKLNEMSGGNSNKLIHGCDIAKELGFKNDFSKLELAVNYLKGESLIEDANIACGCSLGVLKITHYGIKELEAAILEPEKATTYFEPINILYQTISVKNSTGVQIGNNNSQKTSVNIQKNNQAFRNIEAVLKSEIQNATERALILSKLKEVESSVGSDDCLSKYQDFMNVAATHMTVLAPFIPALTQLLG